LALEASMVGKNINIPISLLPNGLILGNSSSIPGS
jgi:hypothetical protein